MTSTVAGFAQFEPLPSIFFEDANVTLSGSASVAWEVRCGDGSVLTNSTRVYLGADYNTLSNQVGTTTRIDNNSASLKMVGEIPIEETVQRCGGSATLIAASASQVRLSFYAYNSAYPSTYGTVVPGVFTKPVGGRAGREEEGGPGRYGRGSFMSANGVVDSTAMCLGHPSRKRDCLVLEDPAPTDSAVYGQGHGRYGC